MASSNPTKVVVSVHGFHPVVKSIVAFVLGMVVTFGVAYVTGVVLDDFMTTLRKSNVYFLLPMIVSFTLFGYLIYKTNIARVYGLNYLAAFVFSLGLSDLFRILSGESLQNTLPFQRGGELFPTLVDLMLPLAVLFLYLHIELINSESPKLGRSILIFSTAAPLVVGSLLLVFITRTNLLEILLHRGTLEKEISDILLFYLFIFGLVVLFTSIEGFHVMYKTLTHADSVSISQGTMLMMAGFASLITNFVLIGIRDSISLARTLGIESLQEMNVHTSYILMGSLFIMLIAYITHPEFAYSVPFDVYQLIVLERDSGTTIFSYVNDFLHADESKSKLEMSLKSPALVAIQSLLKEITFAKGFIETIGLSDRQLIFRTKGRIAVAVICSKTSYFLNKGLSSFTNEFDEIFAPDLENFTGNVNIFKKRGKDLIHRYLPFFRRENLA